MRGKRKHRKGFWKPGGDGETLGDSGSLDADEITEANLRRNPLGRSSGGQYWWVIAKMPSSLRYPLGQEVVRGAFNTEIDATNAAERTKGIEDYETVQLPTRDVGRAKHLWAERRLGRGDKLEQAMENQRHQGQEFGD